MPSKFTSSEVDVPPELGRAIADVRNDATPADWALCVLGDDGRTLRLCGAGLGGAAALAARLTADAVYYGLVRTTDVIDSSTTAVKFVFVSFLGSELSPMRRAKVSTIKGAVSAAFGAYHAEMLSATDPSEVTAEAIDALLHEMFGRARDAPAEADTSLRIGMRQIKMSARGASSPAAPSAFSASQAIGAPADLLAAIADVRRDASATDWALARLADDGRALELAGSGTGGADALAAHLSAGSVFYGERP